MSAGPAGSPLDVLVIEKSGLGGQAGVTERLDNFPGFPDGIGGAEFADRLTQQARRFGVELIETDPLQSTDGAQLVARELSAREPEKYFYPDQYNNPANWRAHYEGTAPEIWKQTEGRITHFIAGLGTAGTFVGISRRLKELNPAIRAISMQPDSPLHGLEGLKHMASALVPGIYDPALADQNVEVSTVDGQEMARRLAREEGLLVGTSSGANVFAALRLALSLPEGSVVVTILCDGGERYAE